MTRTWNDGEVMAGMIRENLFSVILHSSINDNNNHSSKL